MSERPSGRPPVEVVHADGLDLGGQALVYMQDPSGRTVYSDRIPLDQVPGLVSSLQRGSATAAGRDVQPVPVPATEEVTAARYRATDVPKLRDQLLRAWRSGVLFDLLDNHSGRLHFPHHPGTPRMWSVREYETWLLDQLAAAELFYVSPDMSTLVEQAAGAAPYYQIMQDQQPARAGFVVWGEPVCEVRHEHDPATVRPGERSEIVAALWAWVDDCGGGQPGVQVVTLQDSDVMLATRRHRHTEDLLAWMRGMFGPLAYHDEYPLPWGLRPYGEVEQRRVRNQAVAALQATWIMMSQRITVESREQLPRKQARKYTRAGRPAPQVRTVTLRRSVVERQERRPGESGRTYSRRWVVSEYSYWRNTWYPSRGEHRQQLVVVPSYVKGPQGAPLVGGERVNVLRR